MLSLFTPKIISFQVNKKELSNLYFCFAGEFGYEIISWLPYLLFLKNKGLEINVLGRPGSRIFYYFADAHQELLSSEISGGWGEWETYAKIKKRFPHIKIIHPYGHERNRQTIKVDNYEWINKDIHQKIKEVNYSKPNFAFATKELPFEIKYPYVVINNKYVNEWRFGPRNYFSPSELISIRDRFLANGWGVIYNRFREATSVDKFPKFADSGIFGHKKNTVDLNYYYHSQQPLERNIMQISLYNRAKLVITVQGGNAYLPAVCRKNTLILMRTGDYVDYEELARLYKIQLDAFYEPRHLINWLDTQVLKK